MYRAMSRLKVTSPHQHAINAWCETSVLHLFTMPYCNTGFKDIIVYIIIIIIFIFVARILNILEFEIKKNDVFLSGSSK